MSDERGSPRVERGETTISVVAAVISRGERYLVCQRAAGDRHGGLWEFPGGKLEPGESWLEAARRELREELGIEVVSGARSPRFVARDPDSPYEIGFLDVRIEGEPSCHEHQQLAWRSAAELADLPLAPSDRRFAEHLTISAA